MVRALTISKACTGKWEKGENNQSEGLARERSAALPLRPLSDSTLGSAVGLSLVGRLKLS